MMNQVAPISLITISRECGAGGRSVGERLAQTLGWKLWDKELVHAVGKVSGIPEKELPQLEEGASRSSLWTRLQKRPSHRAYLAALKEWMDLIVEQGKAVVVGRGAAILLRYRAGAFHLRLVAPLAQRAERLQSLDPTLDRETALAKCQQMDQDRARYIAYFFGEDIVAPIAYHTVINTGAFSLEATEDLLATLAAQRSAPVSPSPAAASNAPQLPRLLTITSQLGSRETDLGRELAKRLNLQLWDRESLAREAGLADLADADLGAIDSKSVDALRNILADLGNQGNALVVGRGGSEFWKAYPSALRIKLIAPTDERLRRVTEYRWIEPRSAQAVIAESDASRRLFYERHFGINWDDPLHFDMVLNTAALGPRTADLVVQAAWLKWCGQAANGCGQEELAVHAAEKAD